MGQHYGPQDKIPFRTSTLIWIYDKDEQLRLVLGPKGHPPPLGRKGTANYVHSAGGVIGHHYLSEKGRAESAKIPHYNSWYTEELNGEVSLEFTVPAGNPEVSWIQNEGRAVIVDRDGHLVEFIIREPRDRNGTEGPEKEVFAEGGDYELIDEWIGGYKADNVTLETALKAVLSGTRVSVGEVDDFGTQSVNIGSTSVKNAVYELIKLFGGERRLRVDADGPNITKRYIDVLKRRGFDNGQTFEHGRNTMSTSRVVDSTGVKTALYGYGASQENDGPRITFADVEWSVANGDPVDKPLGQTWVGDPDALQEWGYDQGRRHRFGEYSGQEEDPGILLFNTWQDLQTKKDAVRTYDFQVVLFQNKKGYEHLRTRLGDTVYGFDREVQPNIEIEASIIIYKQNLNDSNLDEVTLGNFRNSFETASRVRNVEKVVERDRGNWDKKETPEGAQEKAETAAQSALDAAQQEISDANDRIDAALLDLEGAKTDISDAQDLIDAVTSDKDGVTVLDGTLITNEIIAENAILTGTLTANDAIIISLTTESMIAIDADIQNATITGTLSSVDGTFTGELIGASITSGSTIDVATDANIGDNLYLGEYFGSSMKSIFFNNLARINGGVGPIAAGMQLSADYIQLGDDVYFGGSSTSAKIYFDANDGQFYRTVSETGMCGAYGYNPYSSTGKNIGGNAVNFNIEKDYTPSGVSFDVDGSYGATEHYTALNSKGFWFYIQNTDTTNDHKYWRGTYTC
ncbi:phage tail spike protein [Halobacillus aidingensis]|uniref:Phage minor structural protein, N-terminal region n=1 Tax=Halobacillus aidingensis TaxID=240303 RepID=A0A1H0MEF4_HALAD|nr:phage tail spike protein [Halobacillus aidingensis]SDO78808.1 phage minor structural protein, N-terminal region [Halobacillus aidingensis]